MTTHIHLCAALERLAKRPQRSPNDMLSELYVARESGNVQAEQQARDELAEWLRAGLYEPDWGFLAAYYDQPELDRQQILEE